MCNTCGCSITDGNRHLLTHAHAHGVHEHSPHAHGHHAYDDAPHTHEANGLGGDPEAVFRGLLAHNDHHARENRARLDEHRILTINLMSSPGSGKTSLLESTIRRMAGSLRIAVIEGDLETENDADRIRALGVPAHQITTGTACHLDASLVEGALHKLELQQLDILFIENVGNLVCPASFDLGHHRNVTLLSVTEGDDKPAKYPVMFRAADLMLITKTDLLPYLSGFSPERAERCLRKLASKAPALQLSAESGDGMQGWVDWLTTERQAYLELLKERKTLTPRIQADGDNVHARNPEVTYHSLAPSAYRPIPKAPPGAPR